MNRRNIILAKLLTYSGTLPLIGCAAAMLIPSGAIDAGFLSRTYSAVIISFLCGIHWAVYLFFSEKCPRNLLVTSNVVALIAWLSLITAHHGVCLLLQPFCFLYLLTLDIKLRDCGILPEWFYHLRRNATIIVVLCLSLIVGLS
jgi:hypothetical protein